VHAHRELEHVVAVGEVGVFADDAGQLGLERADAPLVASNGDDPGARIEQRARNGPARGARRARDEHGSALHSSGFGHVLTIP
jgi:hypothetical protein